jgi:hypothetical protein
MALTGQMVGDSEFENYLDANPINTTFYNQFQNTIQTLAQIQEICKNDPENFGCSLAYLTDLPTPIDEQYYLSNMEIRKACDAYTAPLLNKQCPSCPEPEQSPPNQVNVLGAKDPEPKNNESKVPFILWLVLIAFIVLGIIRGALFLSQDTKKSYDVPY